MIRLRKKLADRGLISQPPTGGSDPMALRLERETLRLRVLRRVESSFGFDTDQNCWWFQTEMTGPDDQTFNVLYLLDADFPVSPPMAMMLPVSMTEAQRFSTIEVGAAANRLEVPEGWMPMFAPVPVWRPGDDLMRPIEFLHACLAIHVPKAALLPVT